MDEPIVVFITGCSSGLGRAAAEVLAKKGMRVYAGVRESIGRNANVAAKLRELNSEGRFLRVVELDVSSDASVQTAVRQALEESGRIDVLVNNAGCAVVGPVEAFTAEQWKKLFDTNLFGAVRMNRAVLPSMRHRRKGLLIQISSVSGRGVVPGQGPYSASKFAVGVLAETYRYELAPFGIDSILIEPFFYATGIHGRSGGPADESCAAEYASVADVGNRMLAFMQAALKGPNVGDPPELAERIAELIHMPFGKRPLHTVLPVATQGMFQPLDSFMDQFQRGGMEMMGFKDLLEQRPHAN